MNTKEIFFYVGINLYYSDATFDETRCKNFLVKQSSCKLLVVGDFDAGQQWRW